MKKWTMILGASTAALVASIAYPVYAHCGKCAGDAKEFCDAMAGGKVTLAAAIATAEKEAKGTAFAVMPEKEKDGKMELDIYVMTAEGKMVEVDIDAKTGKMLEMEEKKSLDFSIHEK